MENDPKRNWYVKTPQGIFGPYSSQELQKYGEDGQIFAGYQVRKGEDGDWVRADSIRGLTTQVPEAEPVQPAVRQIVKKPRVVKTARSRRVSPTAILLILGTPIFVLLLIVCLFLFSNLRDPDLPASESTMSAGEPSRSQLDLELAKMKAEVEGATAARLKAEAELAKANAEADAARAKAQTEAARRDSESVVMDENVHIIGSGYGEAAILGFRVGNDGLLYDLMILFYVKDGTMCKEDVALVGTELFVRNEYARVTILEGIYRGKTGWVPRKWLQ